jgi:hypothetical protein
MARHRFPSHLVASLHLAIAALLLAGCLEEVTFPQRTVNDVSFEVREESQTLHHLVIDNPNNVRVGARFTIRVFREGQVEPVYTGTEAIYAPPRMPTVETVDVSPYCADDPSTCGELRVRAVLRETYWLADE